MKSFFDIPGMPFLLFSAILMTCPLPVQAVSLDALVKSQKPHNGDGFVKSAGGKVSRIVRNEAYLDVRRNDERFTQRSIRTFYEAVSLELEKAGTIQVASASQVMDFPALPGPGKKIAIRSGYYLIYGFNKKPKLGAVIMKVEIFTRDGKKDTSLQVQADAGMPSMRGAHETGERPFQISKKGDYLLPINIVMPGDWEIRLTVMKNGQVIFRGRYNFDV